MPQIELFLSNPHAKEVDAICIELGVSKDTGLSNVEVQKRLQKFGGNLPKRQEPTPLWKLLLHQFLDPIIYVLLVATLLAFLFEEHIEGIAILVVIAITATIGFVMEWKSIRSMEALRKMSITQSNVLRNGVQVNLDSRDLVPGDIMLLGEGDVVPADGRILQMESLGVKEDVLTGESGQVEKELKLLESNTAITEQVNMVFAGSMVSRGTAKVVVTHTGGNTVAGKIHQLAGSTDRRLTPLDKKLSRLSRSLIFLTLFLVVFVAFIGFYQGRDLWLTLETAIALAVAAIPEGLPIVATIALARGMLRLAKKRVIIKNMISVETLGEMSVIFTDKTGTLTENMMSVREIITSTSQTIHVDQSLTFETQDIAGFDLLLNCAVLCNNAGRSDVGSLTGDPLEVALLEMASRVDYDYQKVREDYPEILEIPFDASARIMTTLHKHTDNYFVYVKGAVENVLEHCSFESRASRNPTSKDFWLEQANDLASEGLRVLAFAYQVSPNQPDSKKLWDNLNFLGLIGFLDPPRTDVRHAMEIYHQAGIKVVMVTGDHPATAQKIAAECGLLTPHQGKDFLLSGEALPSDASMSDEDKNKILTTTIFARVLPDQKLNLIDIFQKNGFVVGMTGDGINDVPALKKADIGIAMGIRGTEAAKEVADVILRDDQFTSIELAILQGRTIFDNIRKFVVYLMSSNLAEIISVAGASIVNLPLPLLPLQILFLNLVTDIFPALAIGMGKGNADLMKQPPRPSNEAILSHVQWMNLLIYGFSISMAVIGITYYGSALLHFTPVKINNLAFYTLVVSQLLNVFNLPHSSESIFDNEVTRNGWVWGAILLSLSMVAIPNFFDTTRNVLSLVPLQLLDFALVLAFSFSSLLIAQFIKSMVNLRQSSSPGTVKSKSMG